MYNYDEESIDTDLSSKMFNEVLDRTKRAVMDYNAEHTDPYYRTISVMVSTSKNKLRTILIVDKDYPKIEVCNILSEVVNSFTGKPMVSLLTGIETSVNKIKTKIDNGLISNQYIFGLINKGISI